MNDQEQIINNIQLIKHRIKEACEKSGRNPDEVRLLLATKTVEPERIKIAVEAGEKLIGENRVQEYAEKYEAMKDIECERHFIGHLQTNKIKDVLKYVSCIQSLDRMELAEKLHQRLLFEERTIDAFVEINTSFEDTKHGLAPDEVFVFLEKLKELNTIKIKGFMTIGLYDADVEKARPGFIRLRNIRDEAIAKGLVSSEAGELSMGMSGDLETAIEEGATIVRVGSAIFGSRNYS